MDNWFSIEIIDKTTYAISEYKHWEEMHSYLLIGNKRALLIDTGLGIGKIHKIVEKLTSLPVDVVTTHVHWDHIGGHQAFKRHYVHELDSKWMRQGIPIPLEIIKRNVSENVNDLPKTFKIDEYKVFRSNEIEEISGRNI